MIASAKATNVFIDGNSERPSLNWYAGQHVRRFEGLSNSGWILTRDQKSFVEDQQGNDCYLSQEGEEWTLMFCKVK